MFLLDINSPKFSLVLIKFEQNNDISKVGLLSLMILSVDQSVKVYRLTSPKG